MHSAHLAFSREAELWSSLEIADAAGVEVKGTLGSGNYRVSLSDHIAAVKDQETLFAAVLLASYAIAEGKAADTLGVDSRMLGGVEDWGARLLETVNKAWSDVWGGNCRRCGGRRGAECICTRVRRNRRSDCDAITGRGISVDRGPIPVLDYDDLQVYRSRLRSLLRQGTTQARIDDGT